MDHDPAYAITLCDAGGLIMVDWRRLARSLGVVFKLRDPPNIPPHGWSYFDHLVAVYVTLNTSDPRADAVIKKSHERADDLTWGDIFLLENTIFSLQPADVVDRSAWILRERFREIASPSVYEKYIASNIPKDTDTPAKLSLLKADLTRVLDVLHWYYSLIPRVERKRQSLTGICIALVVFYTGILGITLYWFALHGMNFLAMLVFVLYCGIVGGFVSSQRRLQSIPNDGDPLVSVFGLENAGYYLWLSPLLGAIFAVTLTAMFVAGILKGAVFPEFAISQGGIHGLPFFHFTWNTLPKTSEDYGKLCVWAFLAGFAERLVPDSLDTLTSKLDRQQPPAPPQAAHPPSPDDPIGKLTTASATESHETSKPKGPIAPETLQDVMHSGEPKKEPQGDK